MVKIAAFTTLFLFAHVAAATDLEKAMGVCEMEAMRQFGLQRKPHPVSREPWPTDLELEYRESCMRSRGYQHDLDLVAKDGALRIQGVTRSAPWRWDVKYWRAIKK